MKLWWVASTILTGQDNCRSPLWRHLIVLFALLNAATSSANVIYRWETLTTSPTISSSVGEIEIKDDARAAGEGSYEAPPDCRLTNTSCSNADPLSPISRFYFRVNASMPTGADINLNFALGTGARFPLERWFQAAFSISDSLLNRKRSFNYVLVVL